MTGSLLTVFKVVVIAGSGLLGAQWLSQPSAQAVSHHAAFSQDCAAAYRALPAGQVNMLPQACQSVLVPTASWESVAHNFAR